MTLQSRCVRHTGAVKAAHGHNTHTTTSSCAGLIMIMMMSVETVNKLCGMTKER